MLIVYIAGGLLLLVGITFFVMRPKSPKKYPIFAIGDRVEESYVSSFGQLRAAAANGLSLHSNYDTQTFPQTISDIKQSLDQCDDELHRFDKYWQRFSTSKSHAKYVATCQQYSAARHAQLTAANQFADDILPITTDAIAMRQIQQAAQSLRGNTASPDTAGHIAWLVQQTQSLSDNVASIQVHHPVAGRYQHYIVTFLDNQLQQLTEMAQAAQVGVDIAGSYVAYLDGWTQFNDTHIVDLINQEFAGQADSHTQALAELHSHTNPDS